MRAFYYSVTPHDTGSFDQPSARFLSFFATWLSLHNRLYKMWHLIGREKCTTLLWKANWIQEINSERFRSQTNVQDSSNNTYQQPSETANKVNATIATYHSDRWAGQWGGAWLMPRVTIGTEVNSKNHYVDDRKGIHMQQDMRVPSARNNDIGKVRFSVSNKSGWFG